MDRMQYGKQAPDSYKPYDLACKKRPAPGCEYRRAASQIGTLMLFFHYIRRKLEENGDRCWKGYIIMHTTLNTVTGRFVDEHFVAGHFVARQFVEQTYRRRTIRRMDVSSKVLNSQPGIYVTIGFLYC